MNFASRLTKIAVVAILLTMATNTCAVFAQTTSKQYGHYRLLYLESVCQRESGNLDAQFELLERALQLYPDAPEALFDMAQVAEETEMLPDSVIADYYMRAIVATEDDEATQEQHLTYLQGYCEFLLSRNAYDEAIDVCKALTENTTTRDEAYSSAIHCLEETGRYDEALTMLDEWQTRKGEANETIEAARHQILKQLGRYDEAIATMERLESLYGNSYAYPVTQRANDYLQKGDTAEAGRIYRQLVTQWPNDPSVQLLHLSIAAAQHQADETLRAMEDLVLNPETSPEFRVSMMNDYIKRNNDSAEGRARITDLFNRLMTQPLEEMDFPTMYVQFIIKGSNPTIDKLFPAASKMVEIEPTNTWARSIVIRQALIKRDYSEAQLQCDEALRNVPSDVESYRLYGMTLMQIEDHERAVEILRKGLPYLGDVKDGDEVSDYYSAMGDALHQIGQNDSAYAYYDLALRHNPMNVMTLNNYAYFLALEGQRLDKAAEMSERTIKSEPKNATYLDTYAWILFLKKDYGSAREYIDRALESINENDRSSTLYEHAGDIYYFLDLKTDALRLWKEAAEQPDSKSSTTLQKKIKLKKYVSE